MHAAILQNITSNYVSIVTCWPRKISISLDKLYVVIPYIKMNKLKLMLQCLTGALTSRHASSNREYVKNTAGTAS